MGEVAITIGTVIEALQFNDTVGADSLRKFYDSRLSAGDDPENPPTDREKLRAILRWFATTVQNEAREAYEHEQRIAQQETIRDEAETKYDMGTG